MLLLSQGPGGGALSSRKGCALSSPPSIFAQPNPPLFFNRKPNFFPRNRRKPLKLWIASAESGGGDSGSASKPAFPVSSSSSTAPPQLVNVDETLSGSIPVEGVIQFDKPSSSSRLNKWGRVGLLAGGDVLALLLFSAIGRFSHGLPVFDAETLRTADPFIAGWFLSAYFLGGYGEDGRGDNGLSKAVLTATKSWALGILLGVVIRAATLSHMPQHNFIIVTLGSTAFLLIGWRALLFSIFPNYNGKQNDVYKRGSPFELFELLTSLVRRW